MCHGHGDEGIRDSVRAGVRSVEHGTFASAATLKLMRARGTFLVPTLSAVVDLAEPGGEYTDPRLVHRGREMLAPLRGTIPAAHARGIPIVAGTDTSYTAASLSSVAGEVKLLGQFGLPASTRCGPRPRPPPRSSASSASSAGFKPATPPMRSSSAGESARRPRGARRVRLVVAGGWVTRETT